MIKGIVLAASRGYCAGVERAVDTLEAVLDRYGPPVYVRRQIVHNAHVVRDFEKRGVVFVDSEFEVPTGGTVVFSAHGVAPSVHENARARNLTAIDATCPLVTKVHSEVRHYAASGYHVFLIGHAGHDEVDGTMGVAPESITLIETADDAETVEPPDVNRLAYVTQTTLSVDETASIIAVLRRRFPDIRAPKKDDICYATTNRQEAVKSMLGEIDLLLVIGSKNSSNSQRLVETALVGGIEAHLIDDDSEIDENWLDGKEIVGITSGASAPEFLVHRVIRWFGDRGVKHVETDDPVSENVTFRLPGEFRELPLVEIR